MNKDFKTVTMHKEDHAILKSEAEKTGLKICSVLKKMCKKQFPKRYAEVK